MSNITRRITVLVPLLLALIVAFSAPAQAQRLHGGFGVRIVPRPYFGLGVGPFWDPYPYYGYGYYPYVIDRPTAAVRVDVVPKQAQVFIDGYFAGNAGTVKTRPGGHAITLYLPGYRTVTENVYVAPGHTVKMRDTLDQLPAGEVSAPPPQPARAAGQPPDAADRDSR